jgi:aspartate kinase
MKIFKFGGASINSVDRIKKVADIIQSFRKEKLLVVISAMGKTTNALEKVAEQFFSGNREESLALFKSIKEDHLKIAELLSQNDIPQLSDIFTEVEWLLHDKPVREYDYYYDQIVCSGELMSTAIVNNYLQSINQKSYWIDVRDIFRTDDTFRDAVIDWDFTQQKVTDEILPLFNHYNVVIAQGFIGATDANESTTLGREGSDYTAAIFANMLDAENETIWKDVEGVMNADPKKFPDARFIDKLNYTEVIEMAYYGAQVIHPKTIKPLQNKNIPLHVRCFLKPELAGTIISQDTVQYLPPIIVVKEDQALIELRSKDFSFVEDSLVARLQSLYKDIKIRPNLTQNGAISLLCCFDNKPEKIEKLALEAAGDFDVQIEKNLTLLTIRHYTEDTIHELTNEKEIILLQKTPQTVQMIIK